MDKTKIKKVEPDNKKIEKIPINKKAKKKNNKKYYLRYSICECNF